MSNAKRKMVGLSTIAVALFGMLVFPMAAADTAQASNRVCSRVTVPKTLPWYLCLQNAGGTSGTGNGPYGCYTHTKIVCKG